MLLNRWYTIGQPGCVQRVLCARTRMASSQRPAVAQAEMREEKWTVLGRTCGWNSRIAPNTCAQAAQQLTRPCA